MVNIYEPELSLLQQKIMRLLFVYAGKSLNMNGIATKLEVSQPAVLKAIPLLKKKGFISADQDRDSGRWSIEINRDNKFVLGLKRADNLKQIYESGLVQELYDKFPGTTIFLFGSYSKGEDVLDSDIDIAVIGSKEKEINKKFEKVLDREIILNFYESFGKINKALLNNILSGVILKGAVEL